ncbi:hypothetical protein A9Q83_07020 [Alphaproteobacteria bacterium 46_93_T64]|nr:hypothetical protein A9Q83_07020 [Alphaproteobacteria bacterium 46_93_T64]
MIEQIEAHSFLSTPPSNEKEYDGWLLRCAGGRTKRYNSVNFPTKLSGTLPIDVKIEFCEDFYRKDNMACRFRITPLASPHDLDDLLVERGYDRVDPTDVSVLQLTGFNPQSTNTSALISDQISEAWINKLCELTDRDANQRKAFTEMKARLKIPHFSASIIQDGKIVSVGFATVHDGIMGLFEFATDPNYRRQGLAANIVNSLLNYGQQLGVIRAYIQVVQSNEAGKKFWNDVGFTKVEYEYSYLCKNT